MKNFWFILVFLSGFLKAQDSLTWKDCVSFAIENNLTINRYRFDEQLAKLDYRQQINNLLPQIGGSASYGINIGRSVDPGTNDIVNQEFFQTSFGIGGSVDIFKGFVNMNRIALQRKNRELSKNLIEAVKNEISFNVLEYYISTLFYKGLVDVCEEKTEVSKAELQRCIRQKDVGLLAGTDIYEAEAKLAADSLELVKAKGAYQSALLQLKSTMNYPPEKDFSLNPILDYEDHLILDTISADSLISLSFRHLPQIKAAEKKLELAKKLLAIQRGYLSPQLYFNAGWGSGYFETFKDSMNRIIPFKQQFDLNSNQYFELSLQVPIFNAFNQRTNIQKAKINLLKAQNEFKNEIIIQEYEINKALLDNQNAKSEFTSTLKQLDKQKKAFQAAQKKRETGLISLVDFYIISNQLASVKAENIRATMQYFLQAVTIEFYMNGKIID
ncbi:MAG: TolC family protein [Bacteroidales bacterium]|nr:TolC family protein [Bacteroidales bacterium]